MKIFDKLSGLHLRMRIKKSALKEAKRKEEKYEANKNELDNWIEELESIPEEYKEELTDGLIRSLGGKNKLSCICLLRTKDYFKKLYGGSRGGEFLPQCFRQS